MKRQYDAFTDEELIEQLRDGDSAVMDFLMEKYKYLVRKKANAVFLLGGDTDDLVQEGALGLLGCIESYNPDSGNLFLTYAAPAIRNAMIDYIRSQSVSFEAKNLNSIISLDELAKDEVRSKHHFIADPTRQTPEQIYLAQERVDDIHHALYMIEDREEQYLRYRYGFDDDVEHPLTETAKHFHLSESRAKKTEALALDNVWLELPWWY